MIYFIEVFITYVKLTLVIKIKLVPPSGGLAPRGAGTSPAPAGLDEAGLSLAEERLA